MINPKKLKVHWFSKGICNWPNHCLKARKEHKNITKIWIVWFRTENKCKKVVTAYFFIIRGFYCQTFSTQIHSVYSLNFIYSVEEHKNLCIDRLLVINCFKADTILLGGMGIKKNSSKSFNKNIDAHNFTLNKIF